MVVGIAIPISVFLLFGSDGETALAASDHASVCELSNLSWLSGPSEELLDSIEFIHSHHWRMFPRESLSFPCENSGVERVGQQLVDGAETNRFSAHALVLYGPQPPILRCDLPDSSWRVRASEHELPDLLD